MLSMSGTQDAARTALAEGDKFTFSNLTPPANAAFNRLPEIQVAIRAATDSARAAVAMAYTMNRLRKESDGKNIRGKFTPEAQDCLRSAVLFAGAGLDTALKRLAAETLSGLVQTDVNVARKLAEFAEDRISDSSGSVSPKELVRLLLGTGASPRDTMVQRWIYDLESASAQSAPRVEEIAAALGVTNSAIRARIKPTKGRTSPLEQAFVARNEIAHELDVTKPKEAARVKLEDIRRYRSVDSVIGHCVELLDVTQVVTNDVVSRL